ncbi:hypothetical protein Ahy_A07g035154 [Arachis hypogaea]|uniref:MEKHLA domain-containing protein n=1 Tax=Arachis hypogaea TaxID=3818 RepID=A0A445CDJ2_ARAHY|nr:hypothetical protein Ahy_A07g035154 [Arachis hypogaea]
MILSSWVSPRSTYNNKHDPQFVGYTRDQHTTVQFSVAWRKGFIKATLGKRGHILVLFWHALKAWPKGFFLPRFESVAVERNSYVVKAWQEGPQPIDTNPTRNLARNPVPNPLDTNPNLLFPSKPHSPGRAPSPFALVTVHTLHTLYLLNLHLLLHTLHLSVHLQAPPNMGDGKVSATLSSPPSPPIPKDYSLTLNSILRCHSQLLSLNPGRAQIPAVTSTVLTAPLASPLPRLPLVTRVALLADLLCIRVAMAISPSGINPAVGSKLSPGSPEALTLANWICCNYRQSVPVFIFANQAGLDMLETTLVALQDITWCLVLTPSCEGRES